jgi:hypothetical protein
MAALIGQLNSFSFNTIPDTIAGDTFPIRVVALVQGGDTYRSPPFSAELSTSRGAFYVSPNRLNFLNGIANARVQVYLATDTIRLICTDPGHIISNSSNPFNVGPNRPAQYVTLMPGESLSPGSADNGRTGNPLLLTAGVQCTVTTLVTDRWFNRSGLLRDDSLRFASTDPFAQFPLDPRLSSGVARFPVTFRRAGQHEVLTYSRVNLGIKGDTSTIFNVLAGQFGRILVVLPGESLLAGDTTTVTVNTPGKAFRPARVYVHESFNAKVIGTDSCWNRVPVNPDPIQLHSGFSFSYLPAQAPLRDTGAVFSVAFDNTGSNQTLWARDLIQDYESYPCMIDVFAKTDSIAIHFVAWPRDTVWGDTMIRAGQHIFVKATFLDANFEAIPARWVRYVVTHGSGNVADSLGADRDTAWAITDTLGTATTSFVCTRARDAEIDSIECAADGYAKRKGLLIDADPDVMQGKIIAYPNPLGLETRTTTIEYYLPATADNMTVAIYDPFGNPVWSRVFPRGVEGNRSGINKIPWDGFTNSGAKVASGIYVVKVWGLAHTSKSFNKSYRLGVIW